MKTKLFYFIASIAMCCAFAACSTEEDNVELTPMEQELLEIDELTASQSPEDIDDNALVADLTTGYFKAKWYTLRDGKWYDSYNIIGGSTSRHLIFMDDNTVRELYDESTLDIRLPLLLYFCSLGFTGFYDEYKWNYDPETNTLSFDGDRSFMCSKAVVRYYKDHRIIMDAYGFYPVYDAMIISGNIDMNVDNRNRVYSEYDISYDELLEGYRLHKDEYENIY